MHANRLALPFVVSALLLTGTLVTRDGYFVRAARAAESSRAGGHESSHGGGHESGGAGGHEDGGSKGKGHKQYMGGGKGHAGHESGDDGHKGSSSHAEGSKTLETEIMHAEEGHPGNTGEHQTGGN